MALGWAVLDFHDCCFSDFGFSFSPAASFNLHHCPSCPAKPNKCCIGSAMGEGLIELEVIGISGECMLTLNVADSMLGRDLWKTIFGQSSMQAGPSVGCVP